jgi:hypothetical protein
MKTFGEPNALRVPDQGFVTPSGRRCLQSSIEKQLSGGGSKEILPSHDFGDALLDIVDDHG